MKVSELSGHQLDYWVCRALLSKFQGQKLTGDVIEQVKLLIGAVPFRPSTDWAQGGPIIQRALISVLHGPVDDPDGADYWTGFIRPSDDDGYDGETPLIAGMRAYVASNFGSEVPDESI
ncbi:phage protein NinX family protein [Burkholderia vietnamiensis]|uniref:phage protein NinX family protein n=1 Tax=Burkholderia vietnamiensis TaxID=60552 RepID=UPI001B8FDFE0|nr:phage protein NinX family protein [Burkholderia vietnamiensis]MBR8030808.1 DUF2591 domain-containing protein [Burkholderia vietnamiensis]